MKRSILLATLLVPIALAGCHIFVDNEDDQSRGGWWHYCDATGCYRCTAAGCELPDSYCVDNAQCPEGLVCGDRGICRTPDQQCQVSGECNSGFICKIGQCVPGPVSGCQSNDDCGIGATCNNGTCQNTGACTVKSDCDKYGSNYDCKSGSCVLGTPVTPGPACTTAAQCSSKLCVNNQCATCSGDCGGAKTCQLDVHCGTGRRCLDGQCVAGCQGNGDCGSGQVCKSSVCVTAAAGDITDPVDNIGTYCDKADDCGGSLACVNNSCMATCTATGACANTNDICGTGMALSDATIRVCRPDTSARLECKITKDCDSSETCVSGICRTVCSRAVDCASCNDGPVCGAGGFCMTEQEVNAECTLNSDCSGGQACLGSKCVSL
ncbi:MAG: hypothetical protein KC503_32605 [Myxococcales bacterium]|nr:hypothetical protein [Myxococcales bacterium]